MSYLQGEYTPYTGTTTMSTSNEIYFPLNNYPITKAATEALPVTALPAALPAKALPVTALPTKALENFIERSTEVLKPADGSACASCNAGGGLLPVLDCRFNFREVSKHLILLEDHLFQTRRRCTDCIKKHTLTIEAFIEEAKTLDKEMAYSDRIDKMLEDFKAIMGPLLRKMEAGNVQGGEFMAAAQRLRVMRKPLALEFAAFC